MYRAVKNGEDEATLSLLFTLNEMGGVSIIFPKNSRCPYFPLFSASELLSEAWVVVHSGVKWCILMYGYNRKSDPPKRLAPVPAG